MESCKSDPARKPILRLKKTTHRALGDLAASGWGSGELLALMGEWVGAKDPWSGHYLALGSHGAPVGASSIFRAQDEEDAAEVAFWVVQELRGQGWGTELCRLTCARALSEPGLRRVLIACAERNGASCRVAEKVGASLARRLEAGCLYRGALCDVLLYELER